MKKAPFINNTDRPVVVGGITIMPGDNRDIDHDLLQHRPKPVPVTAASDDDSSIDAAAFLNRSVKEIEPELAALTISELQAVKDAESTAEKPRTSLITAIDGEMLSRKVGGE